MFAFEPKQVIRITSLLFNLSMGILLVLGSLSMVFANFLLGQVLFGLGLVLLIGNEFLSYRYLKLFPKRQLPPTQMLSGMLGFLFACLLPAATSVVWYFGFEQNEKILIIALAGVCVATIKIVSRTLLLLRQTS
ncbi:MAG: hypothetical protein N3G80_00245 [Candidatus Micrarchaeota archaeon]|nr:hypothetical protein [Candidatus Micrarchaeota archaeon]